MCVCHRPKNTKKRDSEEGNNYGEQALGSDGGRWLLQHKTELDGDSCLRPMIHWE